jgi:hypothetical protein
MMRSRRSRKRRCATATLAPGVVSSQDKVPVSLREVRAFDPEIAPLRAQFARSSRGLA